VSAGGPNDREGRISVPRRFPRPWLRSERVVTRQVARPLEAFLRTEVGSGALLLAAAAVSMLWVNVSAESYNEFWKTRVSLEIGPLSLSEDLRHVVNDLLMALFFYVVSLEVKRELLFGSLREGGSAFVPAAAALGTMAGAALGYLAVNLGGGEPSGWAIPIATDIAFVLAALGVAGRRVSGGMRAFMLTLAVVDDLVTIALIGVIFADDLSLAWLGAAAAALAAVLALQHQRVRLLAPYVLLAGVLWVAVFESGVHATIAGVALGFLTPASPFYPRRESAQAIASQLDEIESARDVEIGEATMWETSRVSREAVSPLVRMETLLHPYSAYVVLPLFALANAGVALSLGELGDAVTSQVGLGIVLGLVVGAPLGGILFAWLLVRRGGVPLPDGVDMRDVAAMAPLKGIGFTVAIFLATLSFDDPATVDEAKLAILIASALAGVIGITMIRLRGSAGSTNAEPLERRS
jgi:Na+:H+ antiporter, NhaA family